MRALLAGLAAALCLADPSAAEDGRLAPKAATVADFLDCMRAHKAALVTAHRGGVVGGLPENSLEAMAFTASHIPTLLEIDVQRTADGVLMLMHDDDVARTTTGVGKIQELPWAEVSRLSLVNHAGLPTAARPATLEAALAWARGRAVLQLDVKRGVPLEEVAAAVRRAGAQSYALIIVYSVEDAAKVSRADPTISMNVNLADPAAVARLRAAGVDLARVTAFTGIEGPKPEFWADLHRQGVSVSYGVLWQGDMEIAATGDDGRYAALADQGADVLVTDRHFEAYRALERRQDTRAAVRACAN